MITSWLEFIALTIVVPRSLSRTSPFGSTPSSPRDRSVLAARRGIALWALLPLPGLLLLSLHAPALTPTSRTRSDHSRAALGTVTTFLEPFTVLYFAILYLPTFAFDPPSRL